MKRLILIAAAALALAAPAAAGNWPDQRLDAAASQVAGHPVAVWCESSWLPWERFWQQFGVDGTWINGYTYPSQPTTYLSPQMCETLHALLDNGGPSVVGNYYASLAIHALVHESVHQQGGVYANCTSTDQSCEGRTDCRALELDKSVAVGAFGYRLTEPELYAKRIVRKAGKRRLVSWVMRTRMVPSRQLADFYTWAVIWHHNRPAAYLGPCG